MLCILQLLILFTYDDDEELIDKNAHDNVNINSLEDENMICEFTVIAGYQNSLEFIDNYAEEISPYKRCSQ